MAETNGISVVIPNYNGTVLFPHTLPSVFAALNTLAVPYEVIVSDDCSTDGSVAYLNDHYPEIKIRSNDRNSGFSVTANHGIRSASYNLVLLLNSDVKLEKDYFDHLLKYFERPETFGVMGRIIGWNDDHLQDGAKYPSFHNAKIKTSVNYILQNEDEMQGGLYTMYVSGANALLDREKFLQIGGFNEMFSPFYVEDYELSLRAWRLGWICYYEHRAVCRHKTSASITSKDKKHFIRLISNRNKWFVHAIHLSKTNRWLWILQLIFEVLLQTAIGKTYYLKAFIAFLKSSKKIRGSRKNFELLAAGRRLLSVKEVATIIRSAVEGKKIKFF